MKLKNYFYAAWLSNKYTLLPYCYLRLLPQSRESGIFSTSCITLEFPGSLLFLCSWSLFVCQLPCASVMLVQRSFIHDTVLMTIGLLCHRHHWFISQRWPNLSSVKPALWPTHCLTACHVFVLRVYLTSICNPWLVSVCFVICRGHSGSAVSWQTVDLWPTRSRVKYLLTHGHVCSRRKLL